jgi:hypothetical protein
MTKEEVRSAAALVDEIEGLERQALLISKAGDFTLNTAGHTLIKIKGEDKESLFREIVVLLLQEIERRLMRARNKLRCMGVFDAEKAA